MVNIRIANLKLAQILEIFLLMITVNGCKTEEQLQLEKYKNLKADPIKEILITSEKNTKEK